MNLQNPKELFLYDLSALYSAEQENLKILPLLAQEVGDQTISSMYREHEQDTRQQIQNLEQCFRALNSQPMQVENHAAVGLKKNHDAFVQQNPSKEAISMCATGAGVINEHMEIAAYKLLVDAAIHMGDVKCADLLTKNCLQEEAMATKLEKMAYQLGERASQVRA